MKNKRLIASIIALQMILVLTMPVFANAKISDVTSNDASTYTLEEQEVNQEKRIIVKFKDKAKKEKFYKKKSKKLQRNIKKDTSIPMINEEYSTILLDSDASTDYVISDIMQEYGDDIEFAQPDYPISVFANEDSVDENLSAKSFEQDSNSDLLDITKENSDVIVAVIDTGVDINHQSYADKIYKNIDEQKNNNDTDGNGYIDDIYGWDFVNNTDQSEISLDSNHGTHVTGLIASNDIGVGINAKILPLKVFENGTAYTSDILNAIEYAENMGAKIVNCSWGTTSENPALENAIKNSDMLFVCAAGNSALNIQKKPVYPASYQFDNVISVGASNDRDYLAYFSNYGDNVDVVANGYDVYSTFINNNYGKMNGTSMSAAYVTGVAAAVYTDNASKTREQLLNSCDMISTLVDKVNLGRRINYNNAVAGIVTNEVKENTNIDYKEEHINKIINDSDNFELYDLDPEPAQIYAGAKHSVVVDNWGLVRTYGDNTYNQLGKLKNGDGVSYVYYNTVEGLDYVEKISTFENHNLALINGDVYAWGDNSKHQLGHTNGSINDIATKVNFLNDSGNIVDISAGGWFSLAVNSSGDVLAWGDNTYGQLGQGNTGGYSVTPHYVADMLYDDGEWSTNLICSKVSAGKYHALAIGWDGKVYGWGRNSTDHCISNEDTFSYAVATQISGLPNNIIDIEAGDRCSFFLTDDGHVYAMGNNSTGQLGDGTNITRSTPVLLGIENVKDIESNEGSTLFLKSNGEVYACGANTYGQLGQGYSNTRLETPIKIQGYNYKQIAVGGGHNLLFKCNEEYPEDQWYYRNATIYAIGCNDSKQCIRDNTDNITYPTIVREIKNTEDTGMFPWGSNNIRPIDATSVSQMDSTANFYGQQLQVNYTNSEGAGSGYGKYSYLKFDISKIAKERISSAKLHLYLQQYGGDTRASTREIGVYDTYSNEWDGKTMTWDNGRVGLRSLLGSFTVTANGYLFDEDSLGWHEIDITDYLKYNCIDNELSLALKMISTQAHEVQFVSGIYNDAYTNLDMQINKNIPVLEIEYEPEEDISNTRTSHLPSADTYTYQQEPSNNFSANEYLSINYTPDENRSGYWGQNAYLSFDISGMTKVDRKNVNSAALWLYVDATSDYRNSTRQINISANDGLKYNSNTLVWNSDNLTGSNNISDFSVTGNGYNVVDSGWRKIDVTDFIKSSTNSDIEFILKMTSTQAHPVKIRSNENSIVNTRPRLVIDSSVTDISVIDISNNHCTDINSSESLYKYTPSRDDTYIFSSVGGGKLSAILLDEDMNELAVSNDINGDFKMEHHLEKDKSYYINILSNSETTSEYKLYVETPLTVIIK